ncbi:Hypothetical predicted protein [Scomber scombrus]|uniref:Uncharacterized protein n=1 Tax=Scomber scombrus TaxID=13677 RepID=A0AAV1PMD4_SCOSC
MLNVSREEIITEKNGAKGGKNVEEKEFRGAEQQSGERSISVNTAMLKGSRRLTAGRQPERQTGRERQRERLVTTQHTLSAAPPSHLGHRVTAGDVIAPIQT